MNEITTKGGVNVTSKTAQTMSMTSSVTIYHIPAEFIKKKVSMEPCCINIIDTPGLGDSRGITWDWRILRMLTNLIESLSTLDYILMTVKSNENRLTVSNKFIY